MFIIKTHIVRDIHSLALMLQNAQSVEEYKYIKCNLDLLLELYKNLYKEDYKINVSRNLKYESEIKRTDESIVDIYIKEFLKDKDFHNKLSARLMTIIPYRERINSELKPLDYDSFFLLIDDFLKSFNPDIYEIFREMFLNGYMDFITNQENKISEINNIFMLDKKYITFSLTPNLDGCLSVVHELAHAHTYSYIKDHYQAYNECKSFFELYPYFMERMFMLYLEEKGIFPEGVDYLRKENRALLRLYANDLQYFNTQEESKIKEDGTRLCSAMVYLYGNYLSGIKEVDYLNDKKGTLLQIEDFIKNIGKVSKEESLDILGISKEEILSGEKFSRTLKK